LGKINNRPKTIIVIALLAFITALATLPFFRW